MVLILLLRRLLFRGQNVLVQRGRAVDSLQTADSVQIDDRFIVDHVPFLRLFKLLRKSHSLCSFQQGSCASVAAQKPFFLNIAPLFGDLLLDWLQVRLKIPRDV